MVCDTVHHVYIGSGSSVLLGFVAKVVDHLTGTMSGLVRWLYDGLGVPR